MIPLNLPLVTDIPYSFVCKVDHQEKVAERFRAKIIIQNEEEAILSSPHGMFALRLLGEKSIDGDVLLVLPESKRAERIFRKGSNHNTLLVTERCDQLCVMCSQPPKKTHDDRFAHFLEACQLCEKNSVIGISGGEPTLFKEQLFDLIESVSSIRSDVEFHILTNAQHFSIEDVNRLKQGAYRSVVWGIPLYATDAALHDRIVGKVGAFEALLNSFALLMRSGAHVELRTVVMQSNYTQLPALAKFVSAHLKFVGSWSIMQLENIGFAKNRWHSLYWDHRRDFGQIEQAINIAQQHRIDVRLFNFPRCTLPAYFRHIAPASISDWKRKYAAICQTCNEKPQCSGFFEWHPNSALVDLKPL